MPRKSVHLVCNAHLDPVWQWEWEEGLAAAISTFRTAADFCDEYDGFVFNHNEALLYQWIEEYDPKLFKRIRRLVGEGKWHIIGGWFVQPDCNMPSGESFVRQILTAKTYFKEKFGVEPSTAINFDPFGHSRGLVQILAKSGYDSYLFCRPGPDDLKLPSDQFVWVGFDGSRVLAARAFTYGNNLGKARETVEMSIKTAEGLPTAIAPWGVGNHGGGPSRQDFLDLEQLIADRQDLEIKLSTPEAFFAELAKLPGDLPEHEDDLNPWAVGCYTSQVRIKQKHRLLENEIYLAEKMATAAHVQGMVEYPRQAFADALWDLLLSEFHDILPGSSVQQCEESSIRRMDHGLELMSRVKGRAFFALAAGQKKAEADHAPILVYNPHPFAVRAIVQSEIQLPYQNWGEGYTSTPVYQNGQPIPYQNEKEGSNVNLDWRKRVVFAADLEPSSMNRFDCRYELVPEIPKPSIETSGSEFVFDNGEMQVVVNTLTGLVDRYCVHGMDYVQPQCFSPLVIMDNDDAWGMLVRSFREVAGQFELMTDVESARFSGVAAPTLPPVRVIEDGPIRTVVEAVLKYGASAICMRYHLPKNGTEIEVLARVHWNEKSRMLKLAVPTLGEAPSYLGQVAYGVQNLPTNGDEAVAQKWVAVVTDNGKKALTCINDGSYGSDFSEDGLRLTLLRSPAFTGHPIGDRPIVRQDRYEPRIDQGERLFTFWLNAGSSGERLRDVDREALVKNEKPMVVQMFPSGERVGPGTFAVLEGEGVQMTAIKLSEDGKGLVVRLFEPTGKARSVKLCLPVLGFAHEVSLAGFEIKTLRIDPLSKMVVETDLLERAV